MGGTAEGNKKKQSKSSLQEEGRGERESDCAQGDTYDSLHRYNPPTFGLKDVNERTPNGLNGPR